MKFVGVDLHKHVIKLCVVRVVRGKREVVQRRRFDCQDMVVLRSGRPGAPVDTGRSFAQYRKRVLDVLGDHPPLALLYEEARTRLKV